MIPFLSSLSVGYLLGSLPFAYLVARLRGVDIFSIGTRNPGAANVFRTVGHPWGTLVFLGDGLKGAGAVVIARLLGLPEELALGAGLAAVVGHWFPILLKFRGGAGLATAVGIWLSLLPLPSLLTSLVPLAILGRFRSTGHAVAGWLLFFAPVSLVMGQKPPLTLGIISLVVLVLAQSKLKEWLGRRRAPED